MIKCEMVFQYSSAASSPKFPGRRTGGFSEGWYDEGTSIPAVIPEFRNLCRKRALLLPFGAAIIGQEYLVVDPVGRGQSDGMIFPGRAGIKAGMPQKCLHCRCLSNLNNIRSVDLRAIPDDIVIEGEYEPTEQFQRDFNAFAKELNGYHFHGQDLSQAAIPIYSVSALGAVKLTAASSFAVNDLVKILRAKNENGDLVGGVFQVETVASPTSLQLREYNLGLLFGGKMRKHAFVYPLVDSFTNLKAVNIISKKVGAPTKKYVGRASKKK